MKFISETKASILFLAIMSFMLAAATIVEHFAGSTIATAIYHNPLTIILWGLLIVNWALIWLKLLKSKKLPIGSTLLHLSFAVMLCGAFTTMLTEKEGHMKLDEGQTKGMLMLDNGKVVGLPFSIGLDRLEIKHYPGSNNPSGFTSYVTIAQNGNIRNCEVSVNHPLRIAGWRIYQASFDPQTDSSIFSFSHDCIGTTISYTGYALLLLAAILLTLSPNSRFSRLRKQLETLACIALMLFVDAPCANAADHSWDAVAAQDIHGRIVPVDSYCRELMRKIHHDEKYEGNDAIRTILSIMADPSGIYDKPFIYQNNKRLAYIIGQQDEKFANYGCLFDKDGSYKIADLVREALSLPADKRTKFQKDLLKLDEKANLLYSLAMGNMLPIFPENGLPEGKWLSPGDNLSDISTEDAKFILNVTDLFLTTPAQIIIDQVSDYQQKYAGKLIPAEGKIRQELLCNRINPFKTSAMGYMFCALLLMAVSMIVSKNRQKVFKHIILCIAFLVFALHSWGIAARWYCSGQPPLSNAYEVTVFLSWCIALISAVLVRRSSLASAFGILLSGALLLVAGMNYMDPAITPLVPVLQSPWLMFHVAVIIAGYGCFGINFLLSIYCLGAIKSKGSESAESKKASILVEMFALIGLMLMTVGTFLGAVWAGESWGSYWSWDPKETWALITILVYTICTHSRLLPGRNKEKMLCILSIAGFLCVLMTYFGVNYFLSGMHSYVS